MELTRDAVEFRAASATAETGTMSATHDRRRTARRPADRPRRLRAAAARGVDQVPDRPRLGHRLVVAALLHGPARAARPPGSSSSASTGAARPAACLPTSAGAGRRGGERQLLLRAPAAGRERQHHRPGDLADRPDLTRRRTATVSAGPGASGRPACAPVSAVGQGRDHHQGEHQPGIALRGDDGHRLRTGCGCSTTTPRTAGLPGAVSAAAPALAAADPVRRHDHRLRLRRRHPLDPVGTATLAGLPSTVQAGLFAASPAYVQVTSRSRRRNERIRRPQPGHRRPSTTSACRAAGRPARGAARTSARTPSTRCCRASITRPATASR